MSPLPEFNPRFLVPDLSPRDRSDLQSLRPRLVFVAESPHVSEVEPERKEDRRPLCGMAGRQWWNLLYEIFEEEGVRDDVSLKQLIRFCRDHQIAVLNAVQFPLDPKISKTFPMADPERNLGFSKEAGAYSFKKKKDSEAVARALESLRERLSHPAVAKATIHCLGNDALWLVSRALGPAEFSRRVGEKIPHPSAWWRKGGLYGRIARSQLGRILSHDGIIKPQANLAAEL